MQICRYNIGGSGWGTTDAKNFRYGANIERCAAAPQPKSARQRPGMASAWWRNAAWSALVCCRAVAAQLPHPRCRRQAPMSPG